MKFLFFGITQGLTEFLPISSSGHLYLIKRLFGITSDLLPFFVILHLATLLAILIFFRQQLKNFLFKKDLLIHIIIITSVSASLGLLIRHFFAAFFDYRYLISCNLLINGVILLTTKTNSCRRTLKTFSWKDSVILGVLQGIAVFPGISRSGITITGLLKRGFQTQEAFTFSFIMAIPIILGAFLLEVSEISFVDISILNISVSIIAAFLAGIFALKIIKGALAKVKFHAFGYYCLALFLLTIFL